MKYKIHTDLRMGVTGKVRTLLEGNGFTPTTNKLRRTRDRVTLNVDIEDEMSDLLREQIETLGAEIKEDFQYDLD